MPANTLARGNEAYDFVLGATITPPNSIVTTALTAGTYTIPGLQVLDQVTVGLTSAVTTYSMTAAYVSAANTLVIYFSSETGSTVSSAPAINVTLTVVRPENAAAGFAALPTSALA